MSAAPVRTTCPYCGVGCGVIATRHDDGSLSFAGDPSHPANRGRLCSKGTALGDTLDLDDRLLHPLIEGAQARWDDALDLVAKRFGETIAEHGPDSVAMYVSGQLLTEDYYVANKLMKGYVGSANIDTNSRLCMASSVAGHKRAFGSDTVPGCYEDLEEADLVVLVGSNLAWCHPVLYQRLAAARAERGTKVVVIDPRRTATCEIADVHLDLTPGSDVALFNGLLMHIAEAGAIDRRFVWRHTSGLYAAVLAARQMGLRDIAQTTGLAAEDIQTFYALFARTERVVTVYSQGVNQSTAGTDKVNAIINCHLASGRIGRPGMGPFSVTGQPNAMGGREVGGLANMLAAHMELANPEHRALVQDFWASPRIADTAGLKAVDLFRAVADGRIKALWIMATNPVDSVPDADLVRAALETCPFVVVSDVVRDTDTTALAHVLLPSSAWGEKDGTVTNSERRISRQRAFLSAPDEARPDWWQIAQVARRMGHGDAFAYSTPAEIFAEHAGLSAHGNDGRRDFDIGAQADIDAERYAELTPFQWPMPSDDADAAQAKRFFGNGFFFSPDHRARLVATPYREPGSAASPEYPLVLNTGRVRDQWHTMTRTAKAPRLMSHIGEPFIEVSPADASRLGLAPAALAIVESPRGRAVVRVLVTNRIPPGQVFAPMHWTDQTASCARIDALVAANTDPVSGQPELKFTPVAVRPLAAAWYGFAVSVKKPTLRDAVSGSGYWALARTAGGWRAEIADCSFPDDLGAVLRAVAGEGVHTSAIEVIAYHDRESGQHRLAAFVDHHLVAALYVAREPVAVARNYIASMIGTACGDAASRFRILSGRTPADRPDPGPIVCACFGVGRNEIGTAVRAGCGSIDAVGAATRAGTNCGSCRPEIKGLIDATPAAKAV